jgi:hypothetical protein
MRRCPLRSAPRSTDAFELDAPGGRVGGDELDTHLITGIDP